MWSSKSAAMTDICLQYFVERGIPCLGVDPAANCAKAAWDLRRVPTEVAFFGSKAASKLRERGGDGGFDHRQQCAWPTCQTSMTLSRALQILLGERGVATFEFPHVLEMIRNVEFDTIYHEHYSYLSLLALEPMFERHGLRVVDVEHLSTHGGSLRLYVAHADRMAVADSVEQLRQEEIVAGLDRLATYEAFGQRVRHLKRSLLRLLIGLVESGKSVAAYGAPAKGNTLTELLRNWAATSSAIRSTAMCTSRVISCREHESRSWLPKKLKSEGLTTF